MVNEKMIEAGGDIVLFKTDEEFVQGIVNAAWTEFKNTDAQLEKLDKYKTYVWEEEGIRIFTACLSNWPHHTPLKGITRYADPADIMHKEIER